MKRYVWVGILVSMILSCRGSAKKGLIILMPESVQEYAEPVVDEFAQSQQITVVQNFVAGTGPIMSQLYLEQVKPQTDIVVFLNATQSQEIETLYPVVRKEHIDTGYLAVLTREGFSINSLLDLLNIVDLFVWINPLSSSPGRDFMLWTYNVLGEYEWRNFWTRVRKKSKFFVDSWSEAYRWYAQEQVIGMVSYHTDNAYNVYNQTGLVSVINRLKEGWVKQNEYALLLSDSPDGQKLMDFFISKKFQEILPLGNWTLPVNSQVALPEVFLEYVPAIRPEDPIFDPGSYSGEEVEEILAKWQDLWEQAL